MKFTIEISQEDILAIISRANGGNQNVVAEVTADGAVAVKAENRGRPVGSKNQPKEAAPADVAKPVAKAAPVAPAVALGAPSAPVAAVVPSPAVATSSAPAQSLTLQDISKALTEKAQKSGDRDGVLAILRKFAPTVSQVKPEQYAALMAELNGHGVAIAPPPVEAGEVW